MNGRKILQEAGVLIDGHVVGSSGLHGLTHINFDAIYADPDIVSDLCREIAKPFAGEKVDTIITLANDKYDRRKMLSSFTALHLGAMESRKVELAIVEQWERYDFVITERYRKDVFKKKVLVVTDVLNTHYGNVGKVVGAVRAIAGTVVGLGTICNSGGVKAEDVGGIPKLIALADVNSEIWDWTTCPLCKQKIPLKKCGKGWESAPQSRAEAS